MYQRLAKELLRPDLQALYVEREWQDKTIVNIDLQNSTIGKHQSEKSIIEEQTVQWVSNLSETISIANELPQSILDEFSRSELQALVLLHLVNRTLAGGVGLERVIRVFGNDNFSLIVPNSKAALPLDVIVLRNCSGLPTAILRSHTNFRIIPSGTTPDPRNCYADVDAHFMLDLDVVSAIGQVVMSLLCKHLAQEDLLSEVLPQRLVRWIIATAPKGFRETSDISAIGYKIYLSSNTSTTSLNLTHPSHPN